MRASSWTALAVGTAFALLACGDDALRYATVYSCDNTKVATDGEATCFSPDDPKYMTIALYTQPGNLDRIKRIPDPGHGVAVRVLSEKEHVGATWYRVSANGRSGWVAEHLIVLR